MATVQQLTDLGISRSHAYDILAGREQPSLAKAFEILDATGEQFGILKGLSESAVDELRSQQAKAA